MNAPAASHGTTRSSGWRERPENIGPKTSGPQIAPETTPKSTIDIPRARRAGGNISAAAARESSTMVCPAPQRPSPRKTSAPERVAQPAAVTHGPSVPSTKPLRITGIRPTRSEMRPAGPTASAPAIRKTAGPRPRMPLTPVTLTIVTVPSATASWIIPDWKTRPPARSNALRRTGFTFRLEHAGRARTRPRRRARGAARRCRRRARAPRGRPRRRAGRRRARPRRRGPARSPRASACGSTSRCRDASGRRSTATRARRARARRARGARSSPSPRQAPPRSAAARR